ncbi:MAG: hypothetical protein WCO30_02340 [bacterium]
MEYFWALILIAILAGFSAAFVSRQTKKLASQIPASDKEAEGFEIKEII